MKLLLLLCLLPVIFAVPPVWHPKGTCGKSKYPDAGDYFLPAPTIVGGIEARRNEFPWQVSLRRIKDNFHFCAGSVINDYWILSAAHCVKGRVVSTYNLTVGDHKISEKNSTTREFYGIEKVVVHEKYNPATTEFDFSLIKVNKAIKLNENVAAVCAPEYNDKFNHLKAAVSGWGSIRPGLPGVDTLRYTTVNITTNEYCQKIYVQDKITPDMICASDNKNSTERDACQGDSGGPLVVKNKGIFSLVGIVSWGRGCASKYPGVYSRVNYVHDWISSNIK